jgi:hypothetical protein
MTPSPLNGATTHGCCMAAEIAGMHWGGPDAGLISRAFVVPRLDNSTSQPVLRRRKAGMAGDSNVSLARLVYPDEKWITPLAYCSAALRVSGCYSPVGCSIAAQRDKKSLLQHGVGCATAIGDGECSAQPRATVPEVEAENQQLTESSPGGSADGHRSRPPRHW